MTQPDPLELVRRTLRAQARTGALTPECLDDGTLAALADGTIDSATRAKALPHVAGCPRCRGAVASVAQALADAAVAREIEGVEGTGRRRVNRIALPLAAAALLLLLVWPRRVDDGGPTHRDPPADASAPVPISPVGVVANAPMLQWTAVAGSHRYRVTLSDALGGVLYETQLADTVVGAPRFNRSRLRTVVCVDRGGPHRVRSVVHVAARRVLDWGRRFPVMVLGPSLILAALATQSPADSLRLLALRLSESALATETRARPLVVREAVSQALAKDQVDVARNLAAAYALAWRDSFLVREVDRFAAWPPERRAAKLWADSVRRAGIAAFGQDGPTAAIAIWRRALSRASAIGDSAGVGALLGNIGAGFLEDGGLDSAETYLVRSRTLAAAIGDVRVEANAMGSLAGLSEDLGDLAAARERYTAAHALRERIGDTRGMAADYNNLGLLAQDVGDLDEARRQFEAALALNRREGRDAVAATNLVNLAGLASLTGDFARAERLYRDALATWRAREQWADAADALHGLGQLELRRGDYPAARATLVEALAIYDRTGPLADALTVRRELAGALAAQGDLQGALDALRRAQRVADSARAPAKVRAGITLTRADLAVQLNALGEAERLYARAEFLYRQAGDPGGQAEAQQGRGLLFLERENYARAQPLIEAALRTQLGAGSERAAALTRLTLGRLSLERGDTAGARRQLARAAGDLERLGDPVGTAAGLGERAALEADGGYSAAAESLYRAGLTRLGDGVAPEVAWRLHAGLGARAARARGGRRRCAGVARGAGRHRRPNAVARALGAALGVSRGQVGSAYAQPRRSPSATADFRGRRSRRASGCGHARCSSCSRADESKNAATRPPTWWNVSRICGGASPSWLGGSRVRPRRARCCAART